MGSRVIHVGKLEGKLLFLREAGPERYVWMRGEEEAGCEGKSVEEAIAAAHRKWREERFRTLGCGFRYTLPVRDVVGVNALFWQMAASYSSFNGEYFDEEMGHRCFVDNASQEALQVWKKNLS